MEADGLVNGAGLGTPELWPSCPAPEGFCALEGTSCGSRLWGRHPLVSSKGMRATSPDPVLKATNLVGAEKGVRHPGTLKTSFH